MTWLRDRFEIPASLVSGGIEMNGMFDGMFDYCCWISNFVIDFLCLEIVWRLTVELVASFGASDIVYRVYRYCSTTRSALKCLHKPIRQDRRYTRQPIPSSATVTACESWAVAGGVAMLSGGINPR